MKKKKMTKEQRLIHVLNLINGGSLCFLSPEDKAITGGDTFIDSSKKRKKK